MARIHINLKKNYDDTVKQLNGKKNGNEASSRCEST